jgi:hypothetical protein
MAGVFFHDQTHVLGGYQPKIGLITGIGGKKEPGDKDSKTTALREMVEELFGYTDYRIVDALTPIKEENCIDGAYTIYVFSFFQLSRMLYTISTFQLTSPYYKEHPLTIPDLIYKRLSPEGQEITRLHLIPFHRTEGLSPDFIEDIKDLINN